MPTNENFTTYTETDPDARLTVTADRVTAATGGSGDDYLVKKHGWQAFTGIRARFKTMLTDAPTSPAGWSETDPNSRLSTAPKIWGIAAGRIDYTGMTRNEHCYVRTDYGANYFSGDFTHDFTLNISSVTTTCGVVTWALKNVGTESLSEDHLRVTIVSSGGSVGFYLFEQYSTQVYDSEFISATTGTWYGTVERDESVGAYGTLYLRIYTDAAKTTLACPELSLTLRGNQDLRYRFWLQSQNAAQPTQSGTGYVKSVDGPALPAVGICGFTDGDGAVSTWTNGVLPCWVHDSDGDKLGIYNILGQTWAVTGARSLDTEYFVEFRRHGHRAKLIVYSDSAYTNEVDSVTILDLDEWLKWKRCYPIITSSDTGDFGCYVDALTLYPFTISQFTDISRYVPGTLEHDFETYPGTGWTESEPAGTTLEQSSAWTSEGTYSLHIVGKSDGTDDAALSHTFTAPTYANWMAVADVKLASLADGDKAQFLTLKKASNSYGVTACIVRDGSVYRWALYKYSGAWTEYLADADCNPAVDTKYNIKLHYYTQIGSSYCYSLYVDGQLVLDIDAATLASHYPDKVVLGHVTTSTRNVNADRYIDGFWFDNMNVARMSSIIATDDDELSVATTWRWAHPFVEDGSAKDTKVLKSSNLSTSPTFALKQTIDDFNPGLDQGLNTMHKLANGDIYYFNGGGPEPFTGWTDYYMYPYKSTDDGETFSKIVGVSLNEYSFIVSDLYESNKILGVARTGGADPATNPHVKFCTYDTTTDAFSLGATIAAEDDILGMWPNEGTLYRRPSDNALIAILRWDTLSATADAYCSYSVSTDDGATWSAPTSLETLWGQKGASPVVNIIGDYLWITGAVRGYDSIQHTSSWLAQIDPGTLEIVNEVRWSYHDNGYHQDTGNGDTIVGGYDQTEQKYYFFSLVNAGSAGLYKIFVPEALGEESLSGMVQMINFAGYSRSFGGTTYIRR